MSDVLRHKRELGRQGRLLSPGGKLDSIHVSPNTRSVWHMDGGKAGNATCLGCHDAPCIELKEQNFDLGGELSAFPGDPSQEVCPVNAIDWKEGGETVEIDNERCVGCGLCALQCPYGAITLNVDGTAKVETDDLDHVTVPAETGTTHSQAKKQGSLSASGGHFLKNLPDIIAALNDTQTTRLVRNIFLSCGVAANIRRKGDTNVRMDGLLRFPSGQIGVVEIETSPNVLESPRALLEDIAVLHNRFGVPMTEIVPVSVISSFPNVRVEYYQVIDDTENVLGIQCRSLTLASLFIVGWHFRSLEKMPDDLFTTTSGSTDLLPSLKELIPELPDLEPYLGAYRPFK